MDKSSFLKRFFWPTFVGLMLVRLYFMATTGLGDDEAYYWDWSRNLALSYYDHPPLTAWLIRLSTSIFGSNPLGVRLPAFFCALTTAHFLFYLTKDMYSLETAKGAVLLYLLIPLFSIGGLLMVPDAPMGAIWVLSAYVLWKIYSEKLHLDLGLITLGVLMGLGFLSKYTTVLFGISALLFLAFNTKTKNFWRRPSFGAAIIVFVIFTLPVVLWNQQQGWPSFAFHLKERQTGGLDLERWLQFLASQIGLLTPVVFIYAIWAGKKIWSHRSNDRNLFLLTMIAPTLIVFGLQPLFAEFKPHWLAPIYPFLFISLSHFYFENWRYQTLMKKWALPTSTALCVLVFVVFYANLKIPLVAKIIYSTTKHWSPQQDPAADLIGWDKLAEQVLILKKQQEEQGEVPVKLVSWRYQLVSQLAFATQETVYRMGFRKDHYSFTQNSSDIQSHWLIFVADHRYPQDPSAVGLSHCQPQMPLQVTREGFLAHHFFIWLCPPVPGEDEG